MRKLGPTGALLCAAIAVCPRDPVLADEPAEMISSWRQPRATPDVLTSRNGDRPDIPTLWSDPHEDAPGAERLWSIRGTLAPNGDSRAPASGSSSRSPRLVAVEAERVK